MKTEIKKLLFDIRESIHSIEDYLGEERDFTIYQNNKMLRRAIEREFEIIGEAMSRIVKLDAEINISSKKQIISMRNRVIHGYDKTDDKIVWGTIIRHIPILKEEIQALLESSAWKPVTPEKPSEKSSKKLHRTSRKNKSA